MSSPHPPPPPSGAAAAPPKKKELKKSLVDHTYRDYSRTNVRSLIPDFSGVNEELFPSKLHRMLSSPEYARIIAWKRHGRAWYVVDRHRFVNEVLPRHFEHGNFESFNRSVNGWGFKVRRRDIAAPCARSRMVALSLDAARSRRAQIICRSYITPSSRTEAVPQGPRSERVLPRDVLAGIAGADVGDDPTEESREEAAGVSSFEAFYFFDAQYFPQLLRLNI
ncbi:hypothetical protein ACHAWF_000715 [Thalassiosira exigua]